MAGFTLIELVMTMIVIGILAVTALGRLDFTGTFEQRGVYDKVKAGLEFARKAAVAQRRIACVAYNNASKNVTFTLDTRAPETSGAIFCDGSSSVALALPASDRDCGTGNAVCSHGSGAISVGTTFTYDAVGAASTAATFTVTGMPTITVEASTGYVH